MNRVKSAYERLQRWKRNKASERELKAAQELAVLQKQVAIEERRAAVYSNLAKTQARLERAKAIVQAGKHKGSGLRKFADKLSSVNQKFQNVDSEFGRMGNLILGDMGRSRGAEPTYRTIRKEGYVHPADRVMGFKAPVSVRRVKVKPKVQPIQIQVIQGTNRAKKRKPQGTITYDPLWGYTRR
jgi:hypothetical protein